MTIVSFISYKRIIRFELKCLVISKSERDLTPLASLEVYSVF